MTPDQLLTLRRATANPEFCVTYITIEGEIRKTPMRGKDEESVTQWVRKHVLMSALVSVVMIKTREQVAAEMK